MWNGGIGTYVKAEPESNAEVGDRANDGLRVNGRDLRCKMVGEGGNLGFTQRGRVEYALNGGLIYTDAIDNSAGVDCSDHEVNIKILLGGVVASGELTTKQRNDLLGSMTDEVARLVLAHNHAQTLALVMARKQSSGMANVHARYIDALETEGWLDRQLEFLPDGSSDRRAPTRRHRAYCPRIRRADRLHEEHQRRRAGSQRPARRRPSRSATSSGTSRSRCASASVRRSVEHPLRRDIIATVVVNEMVNLSGISFDHRMTEDTGASLVDVMRAWIVSREVFDYPRLWAEIDALDTTVALETQLDLFLDCRRMVERGALWVLRHRRPPFGLGETAAYLKPGIDELATSLGTMLRGRMADVMMSGEASRLAAGVPEQLAERAGAWPLLHTAFDLVDLSQSTGRPIRLPGGDAVGAVRRPRPDVAVGGHRVAAPFGPLADPGALGGARRPPVDAGRADPACVSSGGSVEEWQAINARPVGPRRRDADGDSPGRELRPDDAVGCPPPVAQPRPDVALRHLTV